MQDEYLQAIAQEMEQLTEEIRHYDKLFYQEARSIVDDYTYDQRKARLVELERRYPHLQLPDSPTQHLGERPSKPFPTVTHPTPMGSLSNTYALSELDQFIARAERSLPGEQIDFFCEPKFDGVALSLLYRAGQLCCIATRGNGKQGDDITANAPLLKGIPRALPREAPDSIEVRGEAFMMRATFEALNREREAQGEPLLANPRNTAAGTLKTLDWQQVAQRELHFFPYTLLGEGLPWSTQAERLSCLQSWGFSCSEHSGYCPDRAAVVDYIGHWEEHRSELPMEIDGVVVKLNRIAHQQHLGHTAKSPRWALAYKYKPRAAMTCLEQVGYQVGRTGVVTPVAHLSPVHLAGSTIRRASLYNAQELQRLGLHHGDRVYVEKGGEVIPKVTRVVLDARLPGAKPIDFTTHCPACQAALALDQGGILHYCPNAGSCPPQRKGALYHFVSRQAMDIRSLGRKRIDLLFDQGLVRTAADFYHLQEQDIQGLEGFQALATQRLLAAIQASKQRPMAAVLFALGIRHVGLVVAERLAAHFRSLDRLREATSQALMELPEIGPHIAQSLVDFFTDPLHQAHVEALQRVGLQWELPAEPAQEATQLPLAGKQLVVTGTFPGYTRQAFLAHLKAQGAKVSSSLSGKVDFLVTGQAPGPQKVSKAVALQVPLLDLAGLEALLAQEEEPKP